MLSVCVCVCVRACVSVRACVYVRVFEGVEGCCNTWRIRRSFASSKPCEKLLSMQSTSVVHMPKSGCSMAIIAWPGNNSVATRLHQLLGMRRLQLVIALINKELCFLAQDGSGPRHFDNVCNRSLWVNECTSFCLWNGWIAQERRSVFIEIS